MSMPEWSPPAGALADAGAVAAGAAATSSSTEEPADAAPMPTSTPPSARPATNSPTTSQKVCLGRIRYRRSSSSLSLMEGPLSSVRW